MMEFIKAVVVFLVVTAIMFGVSLWILSPENAHIMMYLPK